MSADNYGIVAQHPETGKWHVLMGSASDDRGDLHLADADDEGFDSELEALQAGMQDYFEYGICEGDWPANLTEATS